MGTNIRTEYSDRVRYFISSRTFGTIKITDPIGWDEDEKEFSRNRDNHGIFTALSNSLSFNKGAKEFIDLVDATDGINAELVLKKESKNDQTDVWENSYTGYLDLSTKETQDNKVSLKFNSGGLESIFKARDSQDVEIDRLDTIDGKPIAPLETVNIDMQGRRIFLESIWKATPMTYYKRLQIESSAGNTRSSSNTFPFDIVKRSHEQANFTYDGMDGNDSTGQSTMMLLIPVDRTRKFKVNVESIVFNAFSFHNGSVNWGYAAVALVKYSNGSNFNRGSSIELYKTDFSDYNSVPSGNVTINASTHIITLNQGESLGLEVMIKADFNTNVGQTIRRSYDYKLISGSINIQEDSEFKDTVCLAVRPFDLANRLVEIMTGRKDAVKSEILQSGKWKNLMITHGFWIRGFSKQLDSTLPENDRKFKPLTTNFRDFISSLSAICNIGVGIEKVGAREYVIIEDLKYFYNQNTTIKLPFQVKNVKRSTDASGYYQSVEIGYEKGGEYEEAMGLDEYNIRNSYTTCIHRVDNTYTKLSKYRSDAYGIEFARRKPFSDYSTEDTNYDQDIFFVDCSDETRKIVVPTPPFRGTTKVIEVCKVRLWDDDFSTIPSGVYSPETAYNLRLSPFNLMLRHGWNISSGLTKYPEFKVRYSSSKGNSSLVTLYPENGEIENNKLERPRFVPEIIEFEHICNDEIMRMVEGRKKAFGKEFRNCYGLVEFVNENGDLEKGYLMTLKPNGAGNFKLLKYYGNGR